MAVEVIIELEPFYLHVVLLSFETHTSLIVIITIRKKAVQH